MLYLHQHFAPCLSEPIYLYALHSPKYFGSWDQMPWAGSTKSSSSYTDDSHVILQATKRRMGEHKPTSPPLGVCTAAGLKVGWLLALSALKYLFKVHLFSTDGRGLFQVMTRYCSDQLYWGPLCWCRHPAEVDSYDFLLDVYSSHVSSSFHAFLQILCLAVQHPSEGTLPPPVRPQEKHDPSAAGRVTQGWFLVNRTADVCL